MHNAAKNLHFLSRRCQKPEDADELNSLHVLCCEQLPWIQLPSQKNDVTDQNCHTDFHLVKLINSIVFIYFYSSSDTLLIPITLTVLLRFRNVLDQIKSCGHM